MTAVAYDVRPVGPTADTSRRVTTVAKAASLLCARGARAVPEVLELLGRELGGAVVLLPPGRPDERRRSAVGRGYPLLAGGRNLGTLARYGAGDADASTGDVLAAVADVLALALAAAPPFAAEDLLLDAEADRDAVADELHDGTAQALLVARYAVDTAARVPTDTPTGLADARAAVQEGLVALRCAIWWQRTRSGDGLLAALAALTQRCPPAGQPRLSVEVAAGAEMLGRLSPAAVAAAYRLVQAVLRTSEETVCVTLRGTAASVLLEITGADLQDTVLAARWRRRARILGGWLDSSSVRLRLTLPIQPALEPAR